MTRTRSAAATGLPADTIGSAVAASEAAIGRDTELPALWPIWIAKRAAFEEALNALAAAENRFRDKAPDLPKFHTSVGSMDAFDAKHRRIAEIRRALDVETGWSTAKEAEERTLIADQKIVGQIYALPTKTWEGILFKREGSLTGKSMPAPTASCRPSVQKR